MAETLLQLLKIFPATFVRKYPLPNLEIIRICQLPRIG